MPTVVTENDARKFRCLPSWDRKPLRRSEQRCARRWTPQGTTRFRQVILQCSALSWAYSE